MRLGISSYTYGWAVLMETGRPEESMGALDLLNRGKSLGVRVVQLCDNLPASTWEEPAVARIAARARETGVSIEVGTRGTAPAHLRRMIAIAARLHSRILRVVIDTAHDRPEGPEVIDRIHQVLAHLESAGVTLAIENHDRFTAESLARIVSSFPLACVGICLDTVNSFGALEGPGVVVETLGPYVVNLHLKDFAVERFAHLQGFTIEGRPLGQGRLNVTWLLGRLKEFGRDPNAIIELWTPPEADPAATIAKEAAWAEQSIQAARQFIRE